MRLNRKAALAGIATLAIAGAAIAGAESRFHTLNVALPDGSIEHIRYTGDVAPKVVIAPVGVAPVALFGQPLFAQPGFVGFDPAPFAGLDRIAAAMDLQADRMAREIDAAQAAFAAGGMPGLTMATAGKLPAGTVSYSYVSTTTGNGTCTRSVRYTSTGDGTAPKMVQQTSGNCSAVSDKPVPAAERAPVAKAPAIAHTSI